jgi:Tol biopolymer transport system component
MTGFESAEARLREWLDQAAPDYAPDDLLEAVAAEVAETGQRPAWLPQPSRPAWLAPRGWWGVVVLVAVLAALLALGTLAILSGLPMRSNGLIAYVEGGDVFVANADGTGARRLTNTPQSEEWFVTWSPDGGRIAYVRCTEPSAVCEQAYYGWGPLFVTDLAGNERLVAEAPAEWISQIAWSPDGTQLAFVHGSGFELTVVDLDGSTPRRLIRSASSIAWSPDSTRLAVSSFVGDSSGAHWRMAISVVEVATGNALQLTDGTDAEMYVGEWSPDGESLTFTRAEREKFGPWRLETVAADGTGRQVLAEELASGADVRGGLWSPDGSLVAFTRYADGEDPSVWTVLRDGSDRRLVRERAVLVRWSPDGQLLAIRTLTGDGSPLLVTREGASRGELPASWGDAWQALP